MKFRIEVMAAAVSVLLAGSMPSQAMDMHSRYGGPTYTGAPALAVTASFVKAGGGPARFSTARALTTMLGSRTTGAEVKKLTAQYGKKRVASWLKVGDFAVADALKIATADGVKLPRPTLSGKKLAVAMVQAGSDTDGTFYVEFMLDKALSHAIHDKVMDDIDAKFGAEADADYHRITNQAFVDAAHALAAANVKLAAFH